jgi:hypothetical protein
MTSRSTASASRRLLVAAAALAVLLAPAWPGKEADRLFIQWPRLRDFQGRRQLTARRHTLVSQGSYVEPPASCAPGADCPTWKCPADEVDGMVIGSSEDRARYQLTLKVRKRLAAGRQSPSAPANRDCRRPWPRSGELLAAWPMPPLTRRSRSAAVAGEPAARGKGRPPPGGPAGEEVGEEPGGVRGGGRRR